VLLAEAGATEPEGKGVAGGVKREDAAGVAEGVDPVGWAAGADAGLCDTAGQLSR
jgi:hypothetical protein